MSHPMYDFEEWKEEIKFNSDSDDDDDDDSEVEKDELKLPDVELPLSDLLSPTDSVDNLFGVYNPDAEKTDVIGNNAKKKERSKK